MVVTIVHRFLVVILLVTHVSVCRKAGRALLAAGASFAIVATGQLRGARPESNHQDGGLGHPRCENPCLCADTNMSSSFGRIDSG